MLFHVKFESRMFSALIWYAYCAYNSKNYEVSILLCAKKMCLCQSSNIDFPLLDHGAAFPTLLLLIFLA